MADKVDRAAPFHQDFAGRLRTLADQVERGASDATTLRTLDAIKLVLLGATVTAESAHRVGRMTLLRAIDRTVHARERRPIDYAHALRATGAPMTDAQRRLTEAHAPSWPPFSAKWVEANPDAADAVKQDHIAHDLERGPTMVDEEAAREVRVEFAWPFALRAGDGARIPEFLPNVSDADLAMAVRVWSARGAPRRTTAGRPERPEKWTFLADLCAGAGLGRVSPTALATDWQDWTGSGFRPKSRRPKKD